MQADKITLQDISIFQQNEEDSVFHHIDFTKTNGGKEQLRIFLSSPLNSIQEITETQQLLQRITAVYDKWPLTLITNGTLMVIRRFYETALHDIPSHANALTAFTYSILNKEDFSIVKYSAKHFTDFVRGMHTIARLLEKEDNPSKLKTILEKIKLLLAAPLLQKCFASETKFSTPEILSLAHFMRRSFKQETFELIDVFSRLDAYASMAIAGVHHGFSFPLLNDSEEPYFSVAGLFHPLLQTPASYDITLSTQKNFVFLTGANMGGKSTFIKAAGIAMYLAHTGMAVPAIKMELSLFDGLLSNIQVEDNIIKGESYFFNEVQRIKKTIEKISDGKKWFILIDELFKGTNVQDAMKCSTAVIEGLLKMKKALFILSTHLYEIGEDLKNYPNIQFRYFETHAKNGQLIFNYQLKEGISNDRLGYLILKREGVVDMLEKL